MKGMFVDLCVLAFVNECHRSSGTVFSGEDKKAKKEVIIIY